MINPVGIERPEVDELLSQSLKNWGIEELTDVQCLALEEGVASGESLIVCAPTSSGKTLVGEIAVHQALRRGARCLYLVSHKALADQKYLDFQRKFCGEASDPFGTVGLSTGDREEGDIQSDILVATYEKGLVLALAGQIDARDSVVVADELQIVGDPSRGPGIEILCAFLRQSEVKQFIALTATVENPNDYSSWLQCRLVQSHVRDVDLRQEIWYRNQCYVVTFGQDVGELHDNDHYPDNTLDIVTYLIEQGRAPILVFTESRREASRYASDFARRRQKHATGIGLAQQLELFSEPTEGSSNLQSSAERRIAFHTADLSPQEREVVEAGFLNNEFDVCFATSTLAAGVNFPFRTVVFPKLTYQYGDRAGTRIVRSDYRNMSGRAGRLGMHDEGYAILVPKDSAENSHANLIIMPENDRVNSQMARVTMRRAVLTLFASGGVRTLDGLREFFSNTYFWYLLQEHNPAQLDRVLTTAHRAVDWLLDEGFIEQREETFFVTPIGQATAWSGLLPSTAKAFVTMLEEHARDIEDRFDELAGGLIHWICSSDEFGGETPSRFLPFPIGGVSLGSTTFVAGRPLLCRLDRADNKLCQSVHALVLFIEGVEDRIIFRRTNMSSGSVYRLAADVGWILDGMRTIAAVPDVSCPQSVGNALGMLARRVRWGSPAETLDIIRVAQRAHVPGFGRQRARALAECGVLTFEDLEGLGAERLTEIVGNRRRAKALLEAIGQEIDITPNRYASVHERLASRLGVEKALKKCGASMDKEYEKAIVELLECETSWDVSIRDDGKRMNEPDIFLRLDDIAILLEIKTASKRSGLIKKEAAFAVLQKGSDYDDTIHRVTLGKPTFDEMSKVKALGSGQITLVEHVAFVEGILRVLAGNITSKEFVNWLVKPGEAEFQRLPGTPTNLMI